LPARGLLDNALYQHGTPSVMPFPCMAVVRHGESNKNLGLMTAPNSGYRDFAKGIIVAIVSKLNNRSRKDSTHVRLLLA
jgi:hypothetical protein